MLVAILQTWARLVTRKRALAIDKAKGDHFDLTDMWKNAKLLYLQLMKQIILVVIAAALLSGCISTKKYAGYVKEVYKKADTSAVYTDPVISIIPEVPIMFDSIVKVGKGQTYCIPALFYWGVKQTFNCELNPGIPVRIFSNECYRYAGAEGLNKKLKGQRLEITINSLPRQFVYSEKEDVIYALIFAITIANQSIIPGSNDLSVSYKLYDGKTVTKQGNIVMKNNDRPFTNNWKSTRKVTMAYLYQYEQNMKMLSRQCMARLVNEL